MKRLLLFLFLIPLAAYPQVSVTGHGKRTGAAILSNIVPPPATNSSLWANSVTPATVDSGDASANELGVKFFADGSGYITGLKFYKAPLNSGTHPGTLWTINGLALGTLTWTGETPSGWQTQSFASPIAICGSTHYVASYFDTPGHFSLDRPYFAAQYNNAPLHGLADGADGGNGVYNSAVTGFPASTYGSSNYWIDVVFQANSSAVAASSISPTSGADGQAITVTGCNFNGTETATVGGVAATVTPGSSTSLTITAPTHANGPVAIVITQAAMTTTLPGAFTYMNGGGAPTITSISPNTGVTTGGGFATITGTGFISVTTVAFGGVAATGVTLVNSTTITCTYPAHAAGAVNVTATNANGTATLTNGFTYSAPATGALLTGMTPASFTLPAGWTLSGTADFEGGSLGTNGASAVSASIDCSVAHTGSCSLTHTVGRGDDTGEWHGPDLTGTRDTYISVYEFDPAGGSQGTDFGIAGVKWPTRNAPQGESFWIDPNSPLGCNGTQYPSNVQNNRYMLIFGDGIYSGSQTFGYTSGCISGAWGAWTQWEVHIKVNDPTAYPTASNGEYQFYRNGVLVASMPSGAGTCSSGYPYPCSNMVGNVDMATFTHFAMVGGVSTFFVNRKADGTCATNINWTDVASQPVAGLFTSPSPCPNQTPPNGFFMNSVINGLPRHWDDIIVLKK